MDMNLVGRNSEPTVFEYTEKDVITYGYATRAIVQALCEGDARRFRAFGAAFSQAVYPGDTLITEGWREDEGRYVIHVRTEGGAVMTNAFAEVAQLPRGGCW